MLVSNYIIFVYEHKTYKNYKNKTFSRMALSFETRNIFWTPSLYQKQIYWDKFDEGEKERNGCVRDSGCVVECHSN